MMPESGPENQQGSRKKKQSVVDCGRVRKCKKNRMQQPNIRDGATSDYSICMK